MITAPYPIYCDEAGFTGENLLASDQPYFVYSSVMISPSDAESSIREMRTKYKLQSPEPKGSDLMRSTRGRAAVRHAIESCGGNIKFAIFDKRLALAGKFVEHVYEPVLSENNALFYGLGFHLYLANLLYMEHMLNPDVQAVFGHLERLARAKDGAQAAKLVAPPGKAPWLKAIASFCKGYKNAISEEFGSLPNWVLELSLTALYTLASHWGEDYSGLEIIADRSKPLEADKALMDALVGREDRRFLTFSPERKPWLTTPSLSRPLAFDDSKTNAGIQLADIVASSIAYAFPRQDDAPEMADFIKSVGSYCSNCILPNWEHLDLTKRRPMINSLILEELGRRGRRRQDPLAGMDEFAYRALHATAHLPEA